MRILHRPKTIQITERQFNKGYTIYAPAGHIVRKYSLVKKLSNGKFLVVDPKAENSF